jgi:ketosteroid isomerase-like protein
MKKAVTGKAIFTRLFGLLAIFFISLQIQNGLKAGPVVKMETVEASTMDKDIIRGLMDAWLKAYNSKNIDALMSLYSSQIYYANNGSNLTRRLEGIEENYKRQFKASPCTRIEFKEELVTVSGDTGYIAGKYQVAVPQSGAATNYFHGRVLLIFQRSTNHSDGIDGWQLIVDFDNQGQDVSKQDF